MTGSKSPFRPSFLKIQRAQRHLQELEGMVGEFLSTEPVKVSTNLNPEQTEYKLADGRKGYAAFSWTMSFAPVPPEMSPVIGDIFHNLRSALDLMAGTLVRLQGGAPDGVYFPFAMNENALDAQIKDKGFDRAGDAAIQLLREFKPYKGGNIELRAIHDLNVRDKHREMIAHRLSGAGPIIDTRPDDGGLPRPVGDPNKPSRVELVFPMDCTLSEKELISTLHSLMETTTRVVEAFESLSTPSG